MDNKLGEFIRKKRGDMSLREFADRCGISHTHLDSIEKGFDSRTQKPINPSVSVIEKIAHAVGLPVHELLSTTEHYVDKEGTVQKTAIHYRTVTIPILGTIRAGIPIFAEGNWCGEVEVPSNLKADFALRVSGDSMSWVGICEGDLTILCQDNSPSPGMIVAAGVEDNTWDATLKFYVEDNGRKLLRAANPEYEDIVITDRHRIIGHVVSILKEPPSLHDYRGMLVSKELEDTEWKETIEACTALKLNGKRVREIVETFALLARGK